MGDQNTSESSWKKMVIAKANNEWVSTLKTEIEIEGGMKSESDVNHHNESEEAESMLQEVDPLMIISDGEEGPRRRRGSGTSGVKNETPEERKSRLAKMSSYAAQRLANETPEQRAMRLKRMSDYSAKRLALETHEQRTLRLARMSAYAAKRLSQETPEQRQARLSRMSIYAAKRKKVDNKEKPGAHINNFSKKKLNQS